MQEILCLRQSIIRGRSTPTSNYCLIITVHDLPLLLFIALHNRLHMIKVPLRDTWTCRTLCLEAMFCVWFNFVMLSHIGIETLPLVHIMRWRCYSSAAGLVIFVQVVQLWYTTPRTLANPKLLFLLVWLAYIMDLRLIYYAPTLNVLQCQKEQVQASSLQGETHDERPIKTASVRALTLVFMITFV